MITMARIIWSWQCCRLLVGNIANGIASKNFFAFLTELGNFKQKWPESSGLDNAADFCLATLPMALPQKIFLLKIAQFSEKCKKFFGGNAIGNVASQKSTTLPRPDDLGHCLYFCL